MFSNSLLSGLDVPCFNERHGAVDVVLLRHCARSVNVMLAREGGKVADVAIP